LMPMSLSKIDMEKMAIMTAKSLTIWRTCLQKNILNL
jgi:hypothetical protein